MSTLINCTCKYRYDCDCKNQKLEANLNKYNQIFAKNSSNENKIIITIITTIKS